MEYDRDPAKDMVRPDLCVEMRIVGLGCVVD